MLFFCPRFHLLFFVFDCVYSNLRRTYAADLRRNEIEKEEARITTWEEISLSVLQMGLLNLKECLVGIILGIPRHRDWHKSFGSPEILMSQFQRGSILFYPLKEKFDMIPSLEELHILESEGYKLNVIVVDMYKDKKVMMLLTATGFDFGRRVDF